LTVAVGGLIVGVGGRAGWGDRRSTAIVGRGEHLMSTSATDVALTPYQLAPG
jgi:hypothetical protein